MLVALRSMAAQGMIRTLLAANAFYVFFPAVYGTPLILVTGDIPKGLICSGLSLFRFGSSLRWVHC
jgi:hypothetical protein